MTGTDSVYDAQRARTKTYRNHPWYGAHRVARGLPSDVRAQVAEIMAAPENRMAPERCTFAGAIDATRDEAA